MTFPSVEMLIDNSTEEEWWARHSKYSLGETKGGGFGSAGGFPVET